MFWKCSNFLDVLKCFFCYSAEDKHHVWLGCRVIQVCAYVYVCKSVFDQKINKTCLKMFIYRILGCAVPPLSSWVTGLMHSCCYGGGWQCVSQEKPRRRGKHEISIENIAHDCTKNINHLNSWRCLCFLVQDLFQKSDQKLHVYDFQTCFPELFSLFGTAVNVSLEQRCQIQF